MKTLLCEPGPTEARVADLLGATWVRFQIDERRGVVVRALVDGRWADQACWVRVASAIAGAVDVGASFLPPETRLGRERACPCPACNGCACLFLVGFGGTPCLGRPCACPRAAPAKIMVDQLIAWPQKATGGAMGRRLFGEGKESCHLSVDGAIEELHIFAERLWSRTAPAKIRSWFQGHSIMPHYDLTPSKREQALALGAVFVDGREQALARRAARERTKERSEVR